MSKKRVVLSGIFYPMAILRFFENALKRRDDVKLITTGVYTGRWIPWKNGMELPEKYAKPPTHILDRNMNRSGSQCPIKLNDIDLWIQCDAGFWMRGIKAKNVVHIATDPHCLDYRQQRQISDHFFNMQKTYSQGGDIYLPYAADPKLHFSEERQKKFDATLIGLQYPNRQELMRRIREQKYSTFFDTGDVFDEYRKIYNQTHIAISWSSRKDLIARVFEAMAMGVPLVTNRVPDMNIHFQEDQHYMGFNSVSEGVDQFKRLRKNDGLMESIAERSRTLVLEKHTYDDRINQIFETVFPS